MHTLFHVEIAREEAAELQPVEQPTGALQYEHETAAGAEVIAAAGGGSTAVAERPARQQTVVNEHRDVGRNDPCPCGSGKKFKRCHGA